MGRRVTDKSEHTYFNMRCSKGLIKKIDYIKATHGLGSRSQAVRFCIYQTFRVACDVNDDMSREQRMVEYEMNKELEEEDYE